MLKWRLAAAAVLIPVVGVWIWFSPTWLFGVLGALVMLYAGWEWSGLSGIQSSWGRGLYLFTLAVWLAIAWWALDYRAEALTGLFAVISLWWLLQVALRIYRASVPLDRWSWLISGWLAMVPAWLALVSLHRRQAGPALVLVLFLIIWAADSGAYFSGRAWGRIRLAPKVSPGKTFEGLVGGLTLAGCAGLVGVAWLHEPILPFVILAVVTALFSVIGDLFESRLKRMAQVKDSGHLIPGHGGLLDRIDSLLAAAPIFALGLQMVGGLR